MVLRFFIKLAQAMVLLSASSAESTQTEVRNCGLRRNVSGYLIKIYVTRNFTKNCSNTILSHCWNGSHTNLHQCKKRPSKYGQYRISQTGNGEIRKSISRINI